MQTCPGAAPIRVAHDHAKEQGTGMYENHERVDEFKQEIAGLQIRTPQAETERWLLIGGVGLMALGVLFIIGGWWGASGTTVIVDAVSFMISGGILGLAMIVIGAALFVRYSSTRYLRYWLIRQIYENQNNTDRSVEAIEHLETELLSVRPPVKKMKKKPSSITPSSPAG
jgi:hypothetical protein